MIANDHLRGTDFVIRQATSADASGIAAAHLDAIHAIGSRFYPDEVVAAWGANIGPALYVNAMASGEVFFIAVGAIDDNPAVLGFATHRVDDNVHGTAVYVRGAAARRGLGSALVRLAEAHAREAGAGSIQIHASLAAVDFYTAHGFVETGRGEFRLRSGARMASVSMRKDLARA